MLSSVSADCGPHISGMPSHHLLPTRRLSGALGLQASHESVMLQVSPSMWP